MEQLGSVLGAVAETTGEALEGFEPSIPDIALPDIGEWTGIAETVGNHEVAFLHGEMGRMAIGQEIELQEPEVTDTVTEEPEEEQREKKQKPPKKPRQEEPGRSWSFEVGKYDDDMYDIAMGLIYLSTGVPADDMYK